MQRKITNILLFLITIIGLFLLNIDNVKAWRASGSNYKIANCINDNSCKLLCAYQSFFENEYYNINIVYYYESKDMEVFLDKRFGGDDKENEVLRYSLDSGSNVIWQPGIAPKLEIDGECPQIGIVNLRKTGFSNWLGEDAICFEDGVIDRSTTIKSLGSTTNFNNLTYCQYWTINNYYTLEIGVSHKMFNVDLMNFIGGDLEGTFLDYTTTIDKVNPLGTHKQMLDYMNEIKDYLNSKVPSNSCSDAKTWINNLEAMVSQTLSELKDRYFLGHELPNFVAKSTMYKDYVNNLQTLLKQIINQCVVDGNMTSSEAALLIEKLDIAIANILGQQGAIPDNLGEGKISCITIFGENSRIGLLLTEILDFIRYLVPILIIILSIVDFLKPIASQDREMIKKAGATLGKRIAIGIAIFLAGVILTTVLSYLGVTCKL